MSFPEIKIVSGPDYKDGDDDTASELENITIRIVDNGYVVRIEDEEEITELVYTDKHVLLKELGEYL